MNNRIEQYQKFYRTIMHEHYMERDLPIKKLREIIGKTLVDGTCPRCGYDLLSGGYHNCPSCGWGI